MKIGEEIFHCIGYFYYVGGNKEVEILYHLPDTDAKVPWLKFGWNSIDASSSIKGYPISTVF